MFCTAINISDSTVVNTGKKTVLLPSVSMIGEIKRGSEINMENNVFWACVNKAYHRVLNGVKFN